MGDFLLLLLAPLFALLFVPLKAKLRRWFYLISLAIAGWAIHLSIGLELGVGFQINEIGFRVFIDQYTKVFLVLINCSWFISIIYSFGFTKYHFQEKRVQFFFYLNILLFVASVSASAGNLTTLFVFYMIGIPLTYPLIRIRGNVEAVQSAKVFALQTALPATFIFGPAILLTASLLGHVSFDGAATMGSSKVNPLLGGALLAMFIVGISKNCVLPFHLWLPKTSPAPAPVSGLIHSAVTVKTGSIAMIKIAVYIFGLDYIHKLTSSFFSGGWLTYLCGLTAVYTAYRALKTDDIKQRFAFSTVGQLCYILLAVLIGTPTGILAAMLHIVTHAIAKSCLFYVAGFYNSVYQTVSVARIGKIMPHTRFVALVIAVCGLSITGFPFLAGYYSKDMMLIEEWHAHYYASAAFLIIGSLVNILYIIGPVQNAFKSKDPDLYPKEIPGSMQLTFVISLCLIVGSNFYVPYIVSLFD